MVIDPVFSSAWVCSITFLTPLPEENIRDMGAKKGLESSLFGLLKLHWIYSSIRCQLVFHFLSRNYLFFPFLLSPQKDFFQHILFVVFVFRIILSHLTEHYV